MVNVIFKKNKGPLFKLLKEKEVTRTYGTLNDYINKKLRDILKIEGKIKFLEDLLLDANERLSEIENEGVNEYMDLYSKYEDKEYESYQKVDLIKLLKRANEKFYYIDLIEHIITLRNDWKELFKENTVKKQKTIIWNDTEENLILLMYFLNQSNLILDRDFKNISAKIKDTFINKNEKQFNNEQLNVMKNKIMEKVKADDLVLDAKNNSNLIKLLEKLKEAYNN